MSKTLEIAREALQQMPPETRLRPEDAAVIAFDRYQALALYNVAGMEPALLERLTAEEARRLLAEITRG